MASDALAPSKRHQYFLDGRLIYEWDQTVSDVNVYVTLPPGARAKDLNVQIKTTSLSFGIKGSPPYLSHDLSRPCKSGDAIWTVEDGELHIALTKATPGDVWPSPFKQHEERSAAQAEEDRRRLMLERFQSENPGFDFTNAEFNGQVPDPATFMGGVKGPGGN